MNRTMNRIAVAATLGGVLLAGMTTAVAQEAVRIGTSSVGSNFYRLAVGAGEVINQKGAINTSVQAVGGSAATVRGLDAGKIEFGIANAFAGVTGYEGTFSFKKSGKMKVRLAVQGGANHRGIAVRNGSGIKSVKDLEGKTIIGKRRPLPELELITNAMLKVYGVDPGKVKIVGTTNTGQALKLLTVGSVDAAVLPYGPKAANIQKPMSDGVFHFLDVSKEKRDAALKHLPGLIFGATQTPEWFDDQKGSTEIFAMNTLFLTHPEVSDDTVYKVVKSIMENNKLFVSYHHQAVDWTPENTLANVQLPFHEGAVRYFKEAGAWTPALEKRQKELLAGARN